MIDRLSVTERRDQNRARVITYTPPQELTLLVCKTCGRHAHPEDFPYDKVGRPHHAPAPFSDVWSDYYPDEPFVRSEPLSFKLCQGEWTEIIYTATSERLTVTYKRG